MDLTKTLSQIVLDHPECAGVLQDRRIDFCCNGGLTLAQACAARGLDAAEVAAALEKAAQPRPADAGADPRSLSTAELVSFIVARHHAFLRGALPFLVPLTAKVAAVHGDHDPRLHEIREEFNELREILDAHLEEEEETLFREVVTEAPDLEHVRRDAAGLRDEHRLVGGALRRIRELSDDYTPPSWACTSYRRLLAELRRLEDDVLRHVHLENDVLLPRFLAA